MGCFSCTTVWAVRTGAPTGSLESPADAKIEFPEVELAHDVEVLRGSFATGGFDSPRLHLRFPSLPLHSGRIAARLRFFRAPEPHAPGRAAASVDRAREPTPGSAGSPRSG